MCFQLKILFEAHIKLCLLHTNSMICCYFLKDKRASQVPTYSKINFVRFVHKVPTFKFCKSFASSVTSKFTHTYVDLMET